VVDARRHGSIGVHRDVEQRIPDGQVAAASLRDQHDIDASGELRRSRSSGVGAVRLGMDPAISSAAGQPDATHSLDVEMHFGVRAAIGIQSHHGDEVDRAGHVDLFAYAGIGEDGGGRDWNNRVGGNTGAGETA
jgi:hypothetical protein